MLDDAVLKNMVKH